MKKIVGVLTLGLMFLLGSCGDSSSSALTLISAKSFESAIQSNDEAIVLDVRTPAEFEEGHISNAVNINWNGSEFETQITAIDKDAPIYIYCLSGGRSGQAASHLRDKGYSKIVELDGGMMAWRKEALPETTDNEVRTSSAELTKVEFDELISSGNYVLVDFHAEWCGPCKKLEPILGEIGKEYSDRVKIVRIDVDENTKISNQMNITGIPDLKLYKNGKLVWEVKGLVEKSVIVEQLN